MADATETTAKGAKALAAIDAASLPPAVQRLLDPKGPAPLRTMAAKGVAPGLKPHEALTAVAMLAEGDLGPIRDAAQATLDNLPPALLAGALTPSLDPAVLHIVAARAAKNAAVMERVLALPQISLDSLVEAAARASEAVSELIATNEERLLKNPAIIEKLYMNPSTRMSTADRILELAVRNKVELKGIPAYAEAAAAIMNELIVEPQDEPSFDDILFREAEELAESLANVDPNDLHEVDEATGEEIVAQKGADLSKKIDQFTVSQKIRKAMLGNATDRALLVRDKNRLVAQAAIKSPKIQEMEVARISASRSVSEDVLRTIANSREWTSSHQIKLNLVSNPRTPFVFVSKLIPFLREHELKALAKSKNVPGAVATLARQQLSRKQP